MVTIFTHSDEDRQDLETHVIGTRWSTVIRIDNDNSGQGVYGMEYSSLTNNNLLEWFTENNNKDTKWIGEEPLMTTGGNISKGQFMYLGDVRIPEYEYDVLVCQVEVKADPTATPGHLLLQLEFRNDGEAYDALPMRSILRVLERSGTHIYVIHPQRDPDHKDVWLDRVELSCTDTRTGFFTAIFGGTQSIRARISEVSDYRFKSVEMNADCSGARLDLEYELDVPMHMQTE
jgi:hypothetical protein